jgi:hypothetical protein
MPVTLQWKTFWIACNLFEENSCLQKWKNVQRRHECPEIIKYGSEQKLYRLLSSKNNFQNPYFTIFNICKSIVPITVASWSKAWIVFAQTQGSWLRICVRLFCVSVALCVGSGLAIGWSPIHGVMPTGYRLRNWKIGQGPQGPWSHRRMTRWMDGQRQCNFCASHQVIKQRNRKGRVFQE